MWTRPPTAPPPWSTGASSTRRTPTSAAATRFTYTVEDSEGLTATAEIAVTVAPVNDAPVMAQGATARVTMSEDGDPRPFDLNLAATDADNDDLTWSASAEPAHGSVTIDGDGLSRAIVYTPDADFNGSDSFTITVDDGQGGQASTVVSVNVLAVNDAPTPGADIARTDEDTPVTVDVLANDSDIDGESLTVAGVDAPDHGTAALVDGSVVYTPPTSPAATASPTPWQTAAASPPPHNCASRSRPSTTRRSSPRAPPPASP
ncbi:MAG: tandem-95 repeat protein [Caldilineaceae bacterium]|nr:tandem-95 repeat protein [Caldilineaceae bacterium]